MPSVQPRALGPSRGAVVLGRCGHATGLCSGAPGSGVGTTLWHFPAATGPITLEDVFFDCEARNSEIRASLKPGLHDDFLLSQSVADAEAGFCTPPLTWMATAERTGVLPPGVASKLYGVLNFLEQGMYGRVGTGGLQALKARQTEKVVELTGALRQSMEVIRAVLAMRPRRRVEVFPSEHCRFVAASDAAEDVPGEGAGGFLLVWRSGLPSREAFVAEVSVSVYSLFTPGDHKIAQLELSMVLYALTARPSRFRGARGVWYIDNVAALMCLIRGRSDSPDLERMANLIHVALFALQTWIYWEWIPSKSNWSDSISRLGWRDPWHRMHHFKCFPAYFPASLWRLPLRPVTLIFELL